MNNASSGQVIALGEASHGAAGLFSLKFETIKALALRDQLGLFALEVPAVAGDIVNAYVLGHEDNLTAVIDALIYPAWQTEEMIEIINWLRTHNQTTQHTVEFAGFDVQHPIWAARGLVRLGVARDVLTPILGADDPEAALRLLAELEAELSTRSDALRYMRLLRQGLTLDRPDLGGASRGAFMASEVLEIVSAHSRVTLLWADNTHITKSRAQWGLC